MTQAGDAAERSAALEALSADQRKRLAAYARFVAPNTGETHEDLLQAAHLRWMESDAPVEGPDRTCEFLYGALNSLRSNAFRHQKVVRKAHGVRRVQESSEDPDPIELGADPAPSQEDALFCQQLYDLCAADDEVQTLVMYDAEQVNRTDIQKETGWDNKKYEAIRRRKIRMIARWKIEGKLP